MASPDSEAGIARRAFAFAMANKVYWVLPAVLVSLLVIGLVTTSSTAANPSIYSVH